MSRPQQNQATTTHTLRLLELHISRALPSHLLNLFPLLFPKGLNSHPQDIRGVQVVHSVASLIHAIKGLRTKRAARQKLLGPAAGSRVVPTELLDPVFPEAACNCPREGLQPSSTTTPLKPRGRGEERGGTEEVRNTKFLAGCFFFLPQQSSCRHWSQVSPFHPHSCRHHTCPDLLPLLHRPHPRAPGWGRSH